MTYLKVPTGLPGRDGRDGAKGENGVAGPSGSRGMKGEMGPSGTDTDHQTGNSARRRLMMVVILD